MTYHRASRLCATALVAVVVTATGATLAFGPHKSGGAGAPRASLAPTGDAAAINANIGGVPLSFEHNAGQLDPQVKFLARTNSYNLFLTATGSVMSLAGGPGSPAAALRLSLVGSDPGAVITGQSPLPGRVSYLAGADPASHHANVSTFGRVAYRSVYPGIDLVYHAKDASQLEYDFLVSPGADPGRIRVGVEGADALRLDDGGNLVMTTAAGDVVQHKPVVFQDTETGRRMIEGSFALSGLDVGFNVGPYDHGRTLVIDPTLAYSSYLGQSSEISDVVVGPDGGVYLSGTALAATFPTTAGAFRNPAGNAFVVKLTMDGTGIIYSAFVTSAEQRTTTIAVAPDGSVWQMGTGGDVPVTSGAFLNGPPSSDTNVYLVHLNAMGTSVLYGSYIGNPSADVGFRSRPGTIALDPNGDVWVAPQYNFSSSDSQFPTTPGAPMGTCPLFVFFDGFCSSGGIVARIHPGGGGSADLTYATYLGGGDGDTIPYSLKVGSDGNVNVFGKTSVSDFPTTPNALSPEPRGMTDAFFLKLHPAGQGVADIVYGTYVGGGLQETNGDMAIGADGTAYMAITTQSFDMPVTPGAYQPFPDDSSKMAVVRLNPAGLGGADLLYGTYFDGPGADQAFRIAVDGLGRAFVVGLAGNLFPIQNPLACCPVFKGPGGRNDGNDAFVAEIDPAGHMTADLLFSTYLNGADGDFATGIAVAADVNGRARALFVVGNTNSTDFPITDNAIQKTMTGSAGFIAKIDLTDLIACTRTLTGPIAGPLVVGSGEVVCVNGASVNSSIVVQPGGEVRVYNSRVAGSITSVQAAAFTLCGSAVAGSVTVTGTPSFIVADGTGCGPNTILGGSNLPSGGTGPGSTTTTTTAVTTTTIAVTTTTIPPATTTTSTSVTSTTTIPPTTTTVTAPPSGSACGALAQQLAVTTNPLARQRIQGLQIIYGCRTS